MTDRTELIVRLEGLDGPCREMDAEIHLLLNPDDDVTIYRDEDTGEIAFIEVTYPDGETDLDEILSYTASIDTSVTLIPSGCDWLVNSRSNFAHVWENKETGDGSWDTNDSVPANLPIAICIAAMHARQTNTDNGE